MNNTASDHTLSPRQIKLLWVIATLVCLVSGAVIIGWFVKIPFLIMIDPHFVPMQFNTALSLFLVGLSLFFVSKRKLVAFAILNAVVLIHAVLVICEYLLNVNFGIDEFFVKGYITINTMFSGRMALNTAICIGLLCINSFCYLNAFRSCKSGCFLASGILSSIVFGISVTALLGYVADFRFAYTWGSISGMAVHTAFIFMLVSTAYFLLVGSQTSKLPVILVVAIGLVASNQIFFALRFIDDQQLNSKLDNSAAELLDAIHHEITNKTNYLKAMQGFFDSSQHVDRNEFRSFSKIFLQDDKNLKFLEWIPHVSGSEREQMESTVKGEGIAEFEFKDYAQGDHLVKAVVKDEYFPVHYVEPLDANRSVLGFDFSSHPTRYQNLLHFRDEGTTHIMGPVKLIQDPTHENIFFIVSPYFGNLTPIEDSVVWRQKNLKGFFLAAVDLGSAINNLIGNSRFYNLQIDIFRGELDVDSDAIFQNLVYHYFRNEPKSKDPYAIWRNLRPKAQDLNAHRTFKVNQEEWLLIISATPEFLSKERSHLPFQGTAVAILFTLLLAFYINDLMRRSSVVAGLVKERTQELTQANVYLEREIENHQRVETAFKASENKLRKLTDAIPGVVYQYRLKPNGEQKILFASKGAKELFGVSADSVIENFDSVWGLVVPNQIQGLQESIQKSASSLSPWNYEFQVNLHDGSMKWVRGTSVPELNSDGSIVWSGIFVDITERKAFEQKEKEMKEKAARAAEEQWRKAVDLEKANENLEQIQQASLNIMEDLEMRRKQLEEQSLELERQTKKAEEANKTKSQFLANMSHEIRTPLNAIVGFSELLKDSNLELQQRDYVNTIRESSDLLLALINDILDISKIEAGQVKLENIDFNLQELIENIFKMMWGRMRHGGVELYYEFEGKTPRVFNGDPTRIRQILINLVGNAVKFTEKGEVSIHVRIEGEHGATDQDVTQLRVEVRDTGIGIPADKRDLIFGHFTQVDLSTTRKYGGTGLGLAISKALVEMMGGKIWVESELGKGSQFIFTLILKNSDRKDEDVKQPAEFAGKMIFIVDDNQISQRILQTYANELGLKVLGADFSGAKALDWLGSAHTLPDVVLCDVMMPQMDGMEFARRVKRDIRYKNLKLIAITANAVPGITKECLNAGFDEFMPKPIIRGDLIQTIQKALGIKSPVASSAEKLEADELMKAACRKLRLLVAEDNPINRKLMEQIFKGMGCQCDFASNGKEAIEKIKFTPYDVVLMDLQMPEIGGIEAAQIIRKELKQTLPIIALTAAAMKEDQELSLNAGMNDYVAKPVNPRRLIEVIYEWGVVRKNPNKGAA